MLPLKAGRYGFIYKKIREKTALRFTCKKDAMALKFFFLITLSALVSPLVIFHGAEAGPIFPEQAIREEALRPVEVKKVSTPVTIKNSGMIKGTPFTIDIRDGLNADEAASLAVLINPSIMSLRKEKSLSIPQLVKSGFLPPLRLLADKPSGTGYVSWLPPERLRSAQSTVKAISMATKDDSLELESSWLEWQSFEAARFYFYRNATSRRVKVLLRQIKNIYKQIYKAASDEKLRQQYPEERAGARAGYEKLTRLIKKEQKQLNESRVGIDHALGLPTYVEIPFEHDVKLPAPGGLPTAKALQSGLSERRIDFLALQHGITEKDTGLMNYVYSKFVRIHILIPAINRGQWLNTASTELEIGFPMFLSRLNSMGLQGTNSKRLFKHYQGRIKRSSKEIAQLRQGIDFISAELDKINQTLPTLSKAAKEAHEKKDVIKALQTKKTILAVKLMRLRLSGRLVDAAIALEIESGKRLIY